MFDEKKPSRVSKTEKGSDVTQKPTNTSYSPFPELGATQSRTVRIVVTGLNGVGKSALTVRFLTKVSSGNMVMKERMYGLEFQMFKDFDSMDSGTSSRKD
ncbi:hypothetical protein BSL78_18423 [Apostichopus japonicus]|uniref:Uncharacterized protein n=1 Tax=Stichopus japonicus TaxID=307972 RepID=A0A2G8K9N6_STIJA|nr:hypothetical protein BSL78_18423 [Apostichopus japonicus]